MDTALLRTTPFLLIRNCNFHKAVDKSGKGERRKEGRAEVSLKFEKQVQTFFKYSKQCESIVFRNWFEIWATRIFNYKPPQFSSKEKFIRYLHDKNNQLIHAEDETDDTAVTLACKNADVETVKVLEKLGADINKTGQYGRNGLLCAARGGKTNIIKYLHSTVAEFMVTRGHRRT